MVKSENNMFDLNTDDEKVVLDGLCHVEKETVILCSN